jgi:hypothetical protein
VRALAFSLLFEILNFNIFSRCTRIRETVRERGVIDRGGGDLKPGEGTVPSADVDPADWLPCFPSFQLL